MTRHKWIPWPGIGQVDKNLVGSILDNRYFCRLAEKKQLGFGYLVFPGSINDRRQHSVGAYVRNREFTSRMLQRKILTKQEAINSNLHALVHDIGHGPFSHVIEPLCKINHSEYGLVIVDKISKDIERCGGDPETIKNYIREVDPIWQIVGDKNFGTEKQDYLIRDQKATHFGPNIEQCIESVFNHLEYRDQKMMVDIKALDAAIEIQRAYTYFYRNVHLEKSCYIVQRFMQKLIFQLLHTSKEKGGITEEELWEMVDGDLLYALRRCQNEIVEKGMATFDKGVKYFPKTAISIRLENYQWLERCAGKPIKVVGVRKDFFDNFFEKSKAVDLERLEVSVAKMLGIETSNVAISHIVEKHRFIPQDVWLFDGPKIYSLKRKDPDYFDLLAKELDKYLCVRVCAVPEYRKALNSKYKQVLKLIFEHVGYEP